MTDMNRYGILFLLTLAMTSFSGCAKDEDMVQKVIERGNVVLTEYDADAEAGCYLGNGRFGAVMSGTGLNMSADEQAASQAGQSLLSHMNHWGRFSFISKIEKHETTADYLLPLMRIHWEESLVPASGYRQIHDVYDGVLETSFTLEDGTKVKVEDWFDHVEKDLAVIRIDLSKGVLPVRAAAVTSFTGYPFVFRETVRQTVSVSEEDGQYKVTVKCEEALNDCVSDVYFHTDAPVEICEDGLRFMVSEGSNVIGISYGKPVDKDLLDSSRERSAEAWHSIWHNGGWMDFPEDNAQKMTVRSMAYLISSHDDFGPGMIQPTNGLSGNIFPFHFVQDLGYISPALMMMGRNDIVMKWIEKFAGEIDDMKRYAKHLWPESEGIYPPWELPFGPIEGYHMPNVPVAFCYEPHNTGYLCRMAVEAAEFNGDREWAEKYAYPLIREVCSFYKSACRKGDDGRWHMSWYPCVGQDEAGGRNGSDYLCSMYSAQYSFAKALDLGLDDDGSIARILEDGLAFDSLMSERGTYHTAHGAANDFGIQKHPVQLDGISYFPIWESPREPEAKAYGLRHDITDGARKPFFQGWTLGQFLLSGSNMKDAEGWKEDWATMRPSKYTDSKWIQVYETSGKPDASFYVTTHGMILQSLFRNYVNDYWGVLDIAGCPVFDGPVSFGNIRTRLGVTVSGSVEDGKSSVVLKADRDCCFELAGERVEMRKGETRRMKL